MNNDPRLAQYKKILKIRTLLFMIFALGGPAAIATGLVIGSEKTAMALFMANGFLLCVIAIWLRAIDICPWCTKPFLFAYECSRMMKGGGWAFRTNCSYCGKPHSE